MNVKGEQDEDVGMDVVTVAEAAKKECSDLLTS